jgi:ribosomal protein S18 acetylase RimI-like enzyme
MPVEGPPAGDLELRGVEPLAIADLSAADIEAAVALWETCGLTRPWNDPRADARLALAGETSTILAGHSDGRLVATAMVGADGHRGWVYYLAVDPVLRGRGHGEAMMRAAETWVRARGMPKLQLMVRSDNAAVIAFYEAIGYGVENVAVLSTRFADLEA